MIEKCDHPVNVRCVDKEVPEEIEIGAQTLYQSSIGLHYTGGWQYLTPHIRNRWRWRFENALTAYNEVLSKNLPTEKE